MPMGWSRHVKPCSQSVLQVHLLEQVETSFKVMHNITPFADNLAMIRYPRKVINSRCEQEG